MEPADTRLSTTALAKKLDIPAQQLFATRRDYGWIQRSGETWVLTPKGEFEGGTYHNSRRFGRYVVWPEHLEKHPLLAAIESNQRISAAAMCRYYPPLHARQINRALAELGLQQHSMLGWQLTAFGKRLGGQPAESDNSGAFYVTWPHEIIDHPVIHRELTRQADQVQPLAAADELAPDLFAAPVDGAGSRTGIDGHTLSSALQARVCNWLYLAQLAHACQRALPTEEAFHADFYLPAGSIYIDCWDDDTPARELSARLHRRDLYRELELRHVEVNAADAARLDETLGRRLLAFGIRY